MVAPPLFGLVAYLLILLLFGTVEMFTENFFSREVLFMVLLTYLFFELNRLVIVILNKFIPFTGQIKLRVSVQFPVSLILTFTVISLVLYSYFTYIEGFSTIRTEIFTFNAIYLLIALFYHLYYFSIMFLNIRNEAKVKEEQMKKKNLLLELQAFKNQVNPGFLFTSLETILSGLYHDKKQTDALVDQLAKTYRYALENHQNEMVPVAKEIENLQPLLAIFKARYGDGLALDIKTENHEPVQVVPGTLQVLVEHAVQNSIVNNALPLHMQLKIDDKNLTMIYPDNPSLVQAGENSSRLKQLDKAIRYYTGSGIREWEKNNSRFIELPLVIIDEE